MVELMANNNITTSEWLKLFKGQEIYNQFNNTPEGTKQP